MGHEHERLSAYLDDELPPAEREQVTAHLQVCPACAERLAALEAVDGALAAQPADAPPGYFEAFPGRVRARLGATPKRGVLPVWTMAAAASLLLAVVTSLTLRQRPQLDTASTQALDQRAEPAAAPPLPSPAAPPTTLQAMRDEQKKQRAREKDNAFAQNRYDESLKREGAFAPAPTESDTRALGYVAPATPPTAPAAAAGLAPERRLPSTAPQPSVQPAGASSPKAQEEEAPAAATLSEALPDAARQQPAAAQPQRDAPSEAADGLSSGRAHGRAAKLLSFESEWERLEARRPRTPEEWRRLREDWRGLVARDPEGPYADQARLRVVEAGHSTWRTSQDAADEAIFREDAAAYLKREAAPEKGRERVRHLLIDPGVR